VLFLLSGPVMAQTPGRMPSGASLEQDLLNRLKSQSVGQGTLNSLALPDEFLHRVADRIVRMDYQKKYRAVMRESTAAQSASSGPSSTPSTSLTKRTLIGGTFGGLVVIVIVVARRLRGARK
jgi:hypothetical protein